MREACRDCAKRILLMHTQRRIRPKKKRRKQENRTGISSSARSTLTFVFFIIFFPTLKNEKVRYVYKVSIRVQEIYHQSLS